jgi:hypothetical protein
VTDRPPYVLTKFTRDNYIRNGFEPATEPAAETLPSPRALRYRPVRLRRRRRPNRARRLEYQHIETAADEAGWELVEEVDRDDD